MLWYDTKEPHGNGQANERFAGQEDLIANGSSIHAGLRTRLWGSTFRDYDCDENLGFVYIEAEGIS